MTHSPTTKTGPFSTRSSSRAVSLACPLWMRRRRNSSRRRWMTGRRTLVRLPERHRSDLGAVRPREPGRMENPTAFWGASEIFCMVIDHHQLQAYTWRKPIPPHTASLLCSYRRIREGAEPHLSSTRRYLKNLVRWESQEIRLSKT